MPGTVLLDALGTLVALRDPTRRLADALGVGRGAAARALRAEMALYRAEHHRASDAAGLAAVRRECAELVRRELAPERRVEEVEAALLSSLVFAPFPDARPALEAWRAAGARLVVCSNWDVSLHEVLQETGLAPLLDDVVTSAEAGVAKPDPRLFARALAGGDPARALHVGDDPATDVAGARAAGIPALLLVRGRGDAADVPNARRSELVPGGGLGVAGGGLGVAGGGLGVAGGALGVPVVRTLGQAVEHWAR